MAQSTFTASRWQVLTYLLCVALFSISFLVFLNSTVSFVITNRIGQSTRVGDAVGTLGFADELVALVACPVWGMLSDRVGVRTVAVAGYVIVGVAMATLVMSSNVYPQLLVGRMAFSVGGAATATMVTAVLPSMTMPRVRTGTTNTSRPLSSHANGSNITPSISSELTITPARYQSNEQTPEDAQAGTRSTDASTSQLAGLVGMFTGLGALLALAVFLPLPKRFLPPKGNASPGEAITYSYWIVAAVALVVALACLFGLRNLPGEERKGWRALLGKQEDNDKDDGRLPYGETRSPTKALPSYLKVLRRSIALGFEDQNIGLGYVGGFVARASSVGISLFIPLFVNAYFFSSGRCHLDSDRPGIPHNPADPDLRRDCNEAYTVAAKLTGTSQLVALLCAPVFGYLSGRYRRYNLPLLLASLAGMVGYTSFGLLKSPDSSSPDGSVGVYFIVALLGISQIGAIVCSLGLLGKGIQSDKVEAGAANGSASAASRPEATNRGSEEFESGVRRPLNPNGTSTTNRGDLLSRNVIVTSAFMHETSPLIPSHIRRIDINPDSSRAPLKGSIAGVYSLAGGAGILLLTKVGGLLFDSADVGSPFWLMAGFNALLFIATVGCGVREWTKHRWEVQFEAWAREEAEGNGNVQGVSGDEEARSGDSPG